MPELQFSLPSQHYFDPELYQQEMQALFYTGWVCVGRLGEVAQPGAFFTRQIGQRNVLILRDEEGELRAFYNTCRHRGSSLCSAERGTLERVIICPYHAWTYLLNGKLVSTPNILPTDNFDKDAYSLYSITVDTWEGFIFINLDKANRPISSIQKLRESSLQFRNYHSDELVVAARLEYYLDCNWKLIVENFSECYHCPGVHPEWCETMPLMKQGGSMPFLPPEYATPEHRGGSAMAEGFKTLTWSGQTNRPYFKDLDEIEQKIITGRSIWPNLLLSYQPDYVHTQLILPEGPTKTHIIYEWLFDLETTKMPDFDPSDAVEIWDLVNQQDFGACLLAQKGLTNPSHLHSVYVPQEKGLHQFNEYIREGLEAQRHTKEN